MDNTAMAAENVIEVRDLCKTYITNKRQLNVLRNVSFTITSGEMVAVMGPSGSGKSTLLYSVSGMDKATAGEVFFCGQDITKLPDNKMAEIRLDEMGFIFQQMYMMKNLTVFDNVILPAMQSKKLHESRKETKARGEELMRKFGIIDTAENDINEVSGGQLQRACIARSMINKPRIIFADEPTGALNRSSSDEVMKEMVRINNEGATIMLVTHDAKVAAKCTRVLFIVDGNIKGEYELGKFDDTDEAVIKSRERHLNEWLMEMGW